MVSNNVDVAVQWSECELKHQTVALLASAAASQAETDLSSSSVQCPALDLLAVFGTQFIPAGAATRTRR